jgi:uncharacterized protein YggE
MKENKMEQNIATTIDGSGLVEAKNDRATFNFMIKARADSLEEAKAKLADKTKSVLKTLEDLKMNLDGDIATSVSNYRLEQRENGEKMSVGYQSSNIITFQIIVDEKINDIFKTCLKIDSNMPQPIFTVKNREVLLEQAVVKASDDAKAKLAKECSLLNITPSQLKIYNWKFGYEGYIPSNNQQAYGAAGVTGPQGSIGSPGSYGGYQPTMQKAATIYQELLDTKLEPGKISVRVAVRVNYIWKE